MTTRETHLHEEPTRRADPAGNERLTAMTGTVLLVLFVAECLTLLNIGNYLTLHVFLGMLLLRPGRPEDLLHAVAFHQVLHRLGGLRAEGSAWLRCSG